MWIFLFISLATGLVWAQNPPTNGAAPVVLPPVASPSPEGPVDGRTQFAGPPKNAQATTAPVMGCAPGPTQAQCLEALRKAQAANQQPKESGMDKAMPILNAVTQMLGGGGEQEPVSSGERMAITGGDAGGNGGYAPDSPLVLARDLKSMGGRGFAAVVPPFQQHFDACTETVGLGICRFHFSGIWGDARHMMRKSCHNNGTAIDVGLPFECANGRVTETSMKAMEVAKCMATQTNNTFGVIFRNATPVQNMSVSRIDPHLHHMHIKLKSCPY